MSRTRSQSIDLPEDLSPVDVYARFARFYDDDYREQIDDLAAVLQLADESGDPILELGCGTGRVMLPLVAAGHTVSGVDISPALLAVARDKLARYAGRHQLIQGDLRSFTLERSDYALAVCASNTLMHLASPADQREVLARAYEHLRPGGLIWLDLFNPDMARLLSVNGMLELADSWPDPSGTGEVIKWSVRTVDPAEQLQDTLFIYEEIAADGTLRRTHCSFLLRFLWRSELELMLELVGFSIEEVWGDYDGRPYDSLCDRLIMLARKPQ